MFIRTLLALLSAGFLLCTCDRAPEKVPVLQSSFPVEVPPPPPPPAPVFDYDTSQWTEMVRLDSTIRLDLRYATDNNFMKQVIYDCGRCFYRPEVARALLKVHQDLKPQGLGLKMYDCYRPGPYQQRLWDVLPDARYVANPKRGSLHSRGAATRHFWFSASPPALSRKLRLRLSGEGAKNAW